MASAPFEVMPTICIGERHFRRRKFGDSVTSAMAHFFKGGDPMEGVALRKTESIATLAFCFLDDLGRKQFDYSPKKFFDEAFKNIGDREIDALCVQINDIINGEQAEPLHGEAASAPEDDIKKKNVCIALVTLALATYGFMSLCATAYRAAFG